MKLTVASLDKAVNKSGNSIENISHKNLPSGVSPKKPHKAKKVKDEHKKNKNNSFFSLSMLDLSGFSICNISGKNLP